MRSSINQLRYNWKRIRNAVKRDYKIERLLHENIAPKQIQRPGDERLNLWQRKQIKYMFTIMSLRKYCKVERKKMQLKVRRWKIKGKTLNEMENAKTSFMGK